MVVPKARKVQRKAKRSVMVMVSQALRTFCQIVLRWRKRQIKDFGRQTN